MSGLPCWRCGYVSYGDEIGDGPSGPNEVPKDRCPECGSRFSERRAREENPQKATVAKKYVVYILEDGSYEVHGGPYSPAKARELKEAMAEKLGDVEALRSWGAPEETARVVTLTPGQLSSAKKARVKDQN